MTENEPADVEAVFREYEALWNGDRSKFDVVSEIIALHDPAAPGGEVHGRDAVEEFIRGVREGFPDFHIETEELLQSGETIMLEWTATGTNTGPIEGLPPTGRSIQVSGMSKVVVEDGAIQEDRIYYDYHDFAGQLGLTFPGVLATLPRLAVGKLRELV